MSQRREKSDRSSQNDSALNLLPLLETPDCDLVETITSLIHENLCRTKDSRLLYGLVDYYMTVESQRTLDILLRLKEPHDKHLFDKITDLIRDEKYRYKSLQLLCNLVYKQPSWLHKIVNHRIMNTLLNLLKTDLSAPNLMSGCFVLICLLPVIPSQFGPFLGDTFDIFSRLAAWNVKKPSFIVDVYLVHLQIVVYTLFHRLYGMFPCNFLAYLRSFYGGRDCNEDNYKVFTLVIKPMLERVRLHPLLVTASKETELSTNRWKKMSYHDIIVDCASISLDSIEGTAECFGRKTDLSLTSNEQNVCSYESAQYVSYSSQSSCSANFDIESAIHESMPTSEFLWTPIQATVLPANAATSPLSLKSKQELKNYSLQLSTEEIVPLDFAVEAKPELLKMELDNSYNAATSSRGSKILDVSKREGSRELERSEIILDQIDLGVDKTILQAIEAKEDDVDKEVSELTSCQNSPSKPPAAEVRHDTPFCSTTQNLTDEPGELPSISMSKRSDSLLKSSEEESEEMFNANEQDLESFAPTFNRYRYFSHCGPPPVIPTSYVKKPKFSRSMSCPANLCPVDPSTVLDVTNSNDLLPAESVVATCSSTTVTSTFVPILASSAITSAERLITYEQLIPMALNPLPDLRQPSSGDYTAHSLTPSSFLANLSPPELLDRYIQSGNLACLSQLSSIPITETKSTDWTHFGGKPPPDEITILRNQVLLLHNQLLFERHRKDVHSERNRRILGRAKRFRMQEEHIVALKEQILLLEQDNRDLSNQMDKKKRLQNQMQLEKEQIENDLLGRISKAEQENSQLLFSNKNLQNLLVAQRKENDEIRDRCKKSQADNTILKHQVERANKKALQCQYIEKNSVFLSKQLILLQELISHYKEKIELLKENRQPDHGAEILNKAASIEINDLRQKLETKTTLLNITKAKVSDLEQLLQEMKSKEKKNMQMLETMKSLQHDEVLIREERLDDLKRMSIQKDAQILNLFKDIEILSEEKRRLLQMANGDSRSSNQPTHSLLHFAHGYNSQLSFLMETKSDPHEDPF